MSSETQPVAVAGTADLAPVAPAPFVRNVVRPLTKVLNPLLTRLAGRRHFPMAAQLGHTGRRSGRSYRTPVGARLSGQTIVIPLTFGNRSDWAQNVRAAGRCSVRLNGAEYLAVNPRFVPLADAGSLVAAAFRPRERASFRLLGIQQVLVLDARPADDDADGCHRVTDRPPG